MESTPTPSDPRLRSLLAHAMAYAESQLQLRTNGRLGAAFFGMTPDGYFRVIWADVPDLDRKRFPRTPSAAG
jgi:hypothetical protein